MADEPQSAKIPQSDDRAGKFSLILNRIFLAFIVLALVAIWFYAENMRHGATATLWAFACLAAGTFVGLLYGIQREPSQDMPGPHDQDDKARGQPEKQTGRYLPNNNLIDVSDWLTKIIVGVGLVELKQIPAWMKIIARPLSLCLGGDCGLAIAVAVVVFFAFSGFLVGYINSRTFLKAMFTVYDDLDKQQIQEKFEALNETSAETKRKIEELDRQERTDTLGQAALDAIRTPKEDPAYTTAIKEVMSKITEFMRQEPTSAKLGFHKARLLRRLGQISNAVDQLRTTFKSRRDAGIPEDKWDASILFNTACYLNVMADEREAANDQPGAETLRGQAWDTIKNAVRIDPSNLDLAKTDDDLGTITKGGGRTWDDLGPKPTQSGP